MTKEQRLEYMRSHFTVEAEHGVVTLPPVNELDIQDEINLTDGFREFVRNKDRPLTSDEI
jgi:hypothetical protein